MSSDELRSAGLSQGLALHIFLFAIATAAASCGLLFICEDQNRFIPTCRPPFSVQFCLLDDRESSILLLSN